MLSEAPYDLRMEPCSKSWLILVDLISQNLLKKDVVDEELFCSCELFEPIFFNLSLNKSSNVEYALRKQLFEVKHVPAVFLDEFIFESTFPLFHRIIKKSRDDTNFGNNVILTLEVIVEKLQVNSHNRGMVGKFEEPLIDLVKLMNIDSFWYLRDNIIKIWKKLFFTFDATGRYLLIRRLYSLIMDNILELKYEPQTIALLIDFYRQSLSSHQENVFRDEVAFFYGDLLRASYSDVSSGFPYYTAVCSLLKFHALSGFSKSALMSAREKLLEPIKRQVEDYVTLLKLKTQQSGEEEDLSGIDLVLFCINDTAVVVKACCNV